MIDGSLLYTFESSDEVVTLQPFDVIVDTISEYYNTLITENTYEVYRATLYNYVSLFVKNKMMIMVFPVICLYVMYTYLEGVLGYGYGIYSLFISFQNDVSVGNHFTLRACITACIVYVVLSGCIYKRVERMIRHD